MVRGSPLCLIKAKVSHYYSIDRTMILLGLTQFLKFRFGVLVLVNPRKAWFRYTVFEMGAVENPIQELFLILRKPFNF